MLLLLLSCPTSYTQRHRSQTNCGNPICAANIWLQHHHLSSSSVRSTGANEIQDNRGRFLLVWFNFALGHFNALLNYYFLFSAFSWYGPSLVFQSRKWLLSLYEAFIENNKWSNISIRMAWASLLSNGRDISVIFQPHLHFHIELIVQWIWNQTDTPSFMLL